MNKKNPVYAGKKKTTTKPTSLLQESFPSFQLLCMALVIQNLFKEFSASANLNEMTGVKI